MKHEYDQNIRPTSAELHENFLFIISSDHEAKGTFSTPKNDQ